MTSTDFLQRWAAALRSGKYTQTRGALRQSDDRFCANGVACALIPEFMWETTIIHGATFYSPVVPGLGPWRGELHDLIYQELTRRTGVPSSVFTAVEQLNDHQRLTFAEIAAYLEERLESQSESFAEWLERLRVRVNATPTHQLLLPPLIEAAAEAEAEELADAEA